MTSKCPYCGKPLRVTEADRSVRAVVKDTELVDVRLTLESHTCAWPLETGQSPRESTFSEKDG